MSHHLEPIPRNLQNHALEGVPQKRSNTSVNNCSDSSYFKKVGKLFVMFIYIVIQWQTMKLTKSPVLSGTDCLRFTSDRAMIRIRLELVSSPACYSIETLHSPVYVLPIDQLKTEAAEQLLIRIATTRNTRSRLRSSVRNTNLSSLRRLSLEYR